MADDYRASRIGLDGILERAQGVDVEVVGRLVEQQDVGTAFENLRQVNPVALAARQDPCLLLLVRAPEVERGHVGPTVDLAAPHDQVVASLGDLLVDGPVRVEGPVLVHVTEFDGRAYPQGPAVGSGLLVGTAESCADDHLEKR